MLDFTAPDFSAPDISADELARLRAIYEPLTESVRALIDATVRTEVDAADVAAAKAQIDSATARLITKRLEGSVGTRYVSQGDRMPWGNAVVGIRNPVAPPLVVHQDGSGLVWSDFHLGAAYEGPPGLVHGGVSALVLDHMLGEAASSREHPRMTGTISIRYHRGTPLGPLRSEAHIDRVDGIKAYAVGHIADADGVTVEAEGVFIVPRWARG